MPISIPDPDDVTVQLMSDDIYGVLRGRSESLPGGAVATLSLPPELVDQLQQLSQAALAYLIRLVLSRLAG